MSIIKRVGWMLMGIVIGALLTTSVSAMRQQTMSDLTPDRSRLRVKTATAGIGLAAFVKDTKSMGCWLVFSKDAGIAITAAPIEACQ